MPQEQGSIRINWLPGPYWRIAVNISDVSMSRFLKTEIVLEISDSKVKVNETDLLPVVRDEIITSCRQDGGDLDNPHRAGEGEIRTKLNNRFNNAVTNVYFNSFIMQ